MTTARLQDVQVSPDGAGDVLASAVQQAEPHQTLLLQPGVMP